MTSLTIVLNITSYIVIILAIILTLFIYISFLFSDKIVRWRANKIKEKRKEVIKIMLQDISLFIQITFGVGAAVLLFSLSREGVQILTFGLMGLVCLTTGIFLLFWRYLPLRNKMYGYYLKK